MKLFKNTKLLLLIAILAGMVFGYNMIFVSNETVLETEFLRTAKEQNVDTIYQTENENGHISYQYSYNEGLYQYYVTSNVTDINDKDIENYIAENNIEFENRGIISEISLFSVILSLAPFILAIFLFKAVAKGIGTGDGLSINKISKTDITFDDVIGHEEVKDELREIITMVDKSEQFAQLNLKMPKGVLLEGPPGVGKTLLAKAMATEAKIAFYSITSADFDSKFLGEGAKNIKKIFNEAKRNAPAIIFIDEFDSVGSRNGDGHQEEHKKINQFLTEMDGLNAGSAPVIVMAATNDASRIDEAIKRSGRLDRTIKMSNPDSHDRELLTEYYMNKYKFKDIMTSVLTARNEDPEEWLRIATNKIAVMTLGMSHADIDNVVSTIVRKLIITNPSEISDEFIQDAVDIVLMGPAKKSNKYSDFDKELVAYHEIGHALVGHYLPKGNKVNRITIVPRGDAGGYTSFQEDKDASKFTDIEELQNSLAVSMAGNVAEEIFMSKNTLGASNDYEKVTSLATRMVKEFGMSDLGLLPRQISSPELNVKIDEEIMKIIQTARKNAFDILTEHSNEAILATKYLVKKESITYNEMLEVINPKAESTDETEKEEL